MGTDEEVLEMIFKPVGCLLKSILFIRVYPCLSVSSVVKKWSCGIWSHGGLRMKS
jgi:hypothetical protein